MKWYKAVVLHKGLLWYYTLKAPDLLTAANTVMVHVECGVEGLMKVKEVKVSEAMQQIIDLNPGRNIFCREVRNACCAPSEKNADGSLGK